MVIFIFWVVVFMGWRIVEVGNLEGVCVGKKFKFFYLVNKTFFLIEFERFEFG